jgi:hypothetical protein
MVTASSDFSAASTDAAILARVIDPARADISPEVAGEFLRWDFTAEDRRRMAELADKARDGALNEAEAAEIDSFIRVGNLLSLMQAKAKLALQRRGQA